MQLSDSLYARRLSSGTIASILAVLVLGASCARPGGSETAQDSPEEESAAALTPENEEGNAAVNDRHALHGGVDAKGAGVHELRAGLATLLVIGETRSGPYREILFELALVGGDAAAALALEFQHHKRMVFEDKDAAFAVLFRSLLATGALVEQRAAVEQALKQLEAPH